MNTALWIVQILAGLAFAMAGIGKLTMPADKLKARMAYVEDFPLPFIRFIAACELLGGVGLILPALTGILPILTPIAASGLVIIMLGAVATHVRRGEYSVIVVNVVLLLMALFIAYGRFVAMPLPLA
jgi:uncharacterized membrane protein YphA (DoxX/SURF4 family)